MTIEEIHAHLAAGNEIIIASYTKPLILAGAALIPYIRADGAGFRLGWPGKGSVYCFAQAVHFVPAGMSAKPRRKSRKAA